MNDPTARSGSEPVMVATDVRKRFGDKEVLRGVSTSIRPGEITTLIGPSGSGKTTLLRCINWLEAADSGDITVNGRPVGYEVVRGRKVRLKGRDVAARRAQIGMVFQHFNLFRNLTALENIALAQVHVKGTPRREADRIGMHWLERVGLADKRDSFPKQLSGGQQQRVAIARVVAMDPALVLMDEPTSALDPELVTEVIDVIRDLSERGITMMIATHQLGFASAMSDTVLFMEDGLVVERGDRGIIDNPGTPRLELFVRHVRDSF